MLSYKGQPEPNEKTCMDTIEMEFQDKYPLTARRNEAMQLYQQPGVDLIEFLDKMLNLSLEVSYWSVLCLDHIIQDCIYSDICYCLYIREKYSSRDLHLDLASTRIVSLYLPWRSRGKQEIV